MKIIAYQMKKRITKDLIVIIIKIIANLLGSNSPTVDDPLKLNVIISKKPVTNNCRNQYIDLKTV